MIVNVLHAHSVFFKAVRPVGWGTRLKLRRWLLRLYFPTVIRWSGCAGLEMLKVVITHSVWLTAWFSNLLCGLLSENQTHWLQPLTLNLIVCLGKLVYSMICSQLIVHLLSPAPWQWLSSHSLTSITRFSRLVRPLIWTHAHWNTPHEFGRWCFLNVSKIINNTSYLSALT